MGGQALLLWLLFLHAGVLPEAACYRRDAAGFRGGPWKGRPERSAVQGTSVTQQEAETEPITSTSENAEGALQMPQGDGNSVTILSVLPAAVSTQLSPTTAARSAPPALSASTVPEDVDHPTTSSVSADNEKSPTVLVVLPVADSVSAGRRANVPGPCLSGDWPALRLAARVRRGRVCPARRPLRPRLREDGPGQRALQR
nr:putative DMBT1-like protein [Microcebus murinus]